MKYIFIVNLSAGKGKYKNILPNIENECKKRKYKYEIRYITDELDGKTIAAEYKEEENVIYIVGGDGTLTRTLPGIVGTKNKIGIIPAGSGNDTYRAIKNLPKGDTKIDLGKVNNTYFINVACTGLDAEVGNNVEMLRKTIIPSGLLYIASIFYTFFSYKFRRVKIKTDIKQIDNEYSILSICNGGFYGGGFNIAPKSLLTDGILDIYFVEKMSKIRMIPLLLKLKKGKHEGKRKVHKYRVKSIELELEDNINFNVDGEKIVDKKFNITILPKMITYYNDDEFVKKCMKGK